MEHEEKVEQHLQQLRHERAAKLQESIHTAIMASGIEALMVAHGELCFHFDDGMTMQIDFNAEKQTNG